jgi:hypothetical protein
LRTKTFEKDAAEFKKVNEDLEKLYNAQQKRFEAEEN